MATEERQDEAAEHRAGFCAILGPPNAGKSTFLNRALGASIAAVSPLPQTTRNRILGVVNIPRGGRGPAEDAAAEDAAAEDGLASALADGAQIVFFDTPGAQADRGPLGSFMQGELMSAAAECDVALVFADASAASQRTPGALSPERQRALDDALSAARAPAVLALNKVDRLRDKRELLPIIEAYRDTGRFGAIVPISALTGDGLDRLKVEVAARLPRGAKLFPEEMITDRAERFLAGELIREQLFLQLGQEVPYSTAVVVEDFRERRDRGDVVIDAAIHVERESQKGIVVGRAGRQIKEVGARARTAVGELLGCPVHVRLHVKVSPKWSRSPSKLREVGYER